MDYIEAFEKHFLSSIVIVSPDLFIDLQVMQNEIIAIYRKVRDHLFC